jgi:hypothetical protein
MIYKSSWNHQGNRAIFSKDFLECSVIVFFEVCDGFLVSTIWRVGSPYFGGSHLTHFFNIYLYNILGWSSFPCIRPIIRPIIHPSKFLIPEEEDDGRGGGGLHSVRRSQVPTNVLRYLGTLTLIPSKCVKIHFKKIILQLHLPSMIFDYLLN